MTITNGQFRDTDNIGHPHNTGQRQLKQKQNKKQKTQHNTEN